MGEQLRWSYTVMDGLYTESASIYHYVALQWTYVCRTWDNASWSEKGKGKREFSCSRIPFPFPFPFSLSTSSRHSQSWRRPEHHVTWEVGRYCFNKCINITYTEQRYQAMTRLIPWPDPLGKASKRGKVKVGTFLGAWWKSSTRNVRDRKAVCWLWLLVVCCLECLAHVIFFWRIWM